MTNRTAWHAFARATIAAACLLSAPLAVQAAAQAPGAAPLPTARPVLVSPALATPVLATPALGAQSASLVLRAPPRTAAAPRPTPIAPFGDVLVSEAGLTGHVGFVLLDMASGAVLDASHADGAFPPASTVKAITAVYALEALGATHRFATELRTKGPITGGTLSGPLALVGGGDPDLDTDDLADLLRDAAQAGLRRATGGLIVDAGALPAIARIDPEQPEHVAYNPSVGGVNLNYNRALFAWHKVAGGHDLSVLASARRNQPPISAVQVTLGVQGAPVFTALGRRNGAEAWEVAPDALGKDGRRWLPVRQPDLYAGDTLRALGAAQDLAMSAPQAGAAPQGMTVIARHESAELRDIIRGMLRWSTNLTAEAVGLAAAGAGGPPVRDLDQSSDRMSAWMARRVGGAANAGLRLHNHSGLSAQSRISPMQMAAFLRAAALGTGPQPVKPGNPGSLVPLIGTEVAAYGAPGVAAGTRQDADLPRGDLYGLLRPVALGSGKDAPPKGVQAVAKTGTLLFVRGLVGYLDAASGRRLAFAIYAEDLSRRSGLEDLESDRGASGWSLRARSMEKRLLNGWARRY